MFQVLSTWNNLTDTCLIFRPISTSKSHLSVDHGPTLSIEQGKSKNSVVLKLNRFPVNTFNLEFLNQLNKQLDEIENSNEIQGVILTSSLPNIFSAGLELSELYPGKVENVRSFWSAFQDFWYKLYGSKKIYVAAINVRI